MEVSEVRKILFLVDYRGEGLGNLMRCVALAEALNVEVTLCVGDYNVRRIHSSKT